MTTNQVTQTDPGARARVIKLGLDLHSSLIVAVRQVDEQPSQPPQRFSEDEFLAFVRRQLTQAESVPSCYEAGPFGYVLHRRLEAMGVYNRVVRPRDWSTYGERVKTDGRDAGALCSCLDRYLAGNRGALAVVWIPSEAQEAARSVGRQRQSLARERVRLTLRGKGLARLRGLSRLQGSITRHGNPRIRHLLGEAAWRLLRYQPDYHAVAKWRPAFLATPRSPGRRKKIVVAIARQLAIDLWRIDTGRATAHQLGFATV